MEQKKKIYTREDLMKTIVHRLVVIGEKYHYVFSGSLVYQLFIEAGQGPMKALRMLEKYFDLSKTPNGDKIYSEFCSPKGWNLLKAMHKMQIKVDKISPVVIYYSVPGINAAASLAKGGYKVIYNCKSITAEDLISDSDFLEALTEGLPVVIDNVNASVDILHFLRYVARNNGYFEFGGASYQVHPNFKIIGIVNAHNHHEDGEVYDRYFDVLFGNTVFIDPAYAK